MTAKQSSSNLATEVNEKKWKICSDETMNANKKAATLLKSYLTETASESEFEIFTEGGIVRRTTTFLS